ncbi:MAG: hypothetical protein EA412_01975 [Chitinophagaceae bacterium]|nr:MAG: hypothetical protein EA412_01975 [Chitinophagaceae bacterium]
MFSFNAAIACGGGSKAVAETEKTEVAKACSGKDKAEAKACCASKRAANEAEASTGTEVAAADVKKDEE